MLSPASSPDSYCLPRQAVGQGCVYDNHQLFGFWAGVVGACKVFCLVVADSCVMLSVAKLAEWPGNTDVAGRWQGRVHQVGLGWRQSMWVDWGGLHCVGLVLLLQAAVCVKYLNPLTAGQ